MKKKHSIKMILISLCLILSLVSLFSYMFKDRYEVEVDIDNEKILDIQFEYKEGNFFVKEKNMVYIKTTKKTHVIDRYYYKNVEFVKSNESTLTKKDKVSSLLLGMSIRKSYITINLSEKNLKNVEDLYEEEFKIDLEVLDKSKFEF